MQTSLNLPNCFLATSDLRFASSSFSSCLVEASAISGAAWSIWTSIKFSSAAVRNGPQNEPICMSSRDFNLLWAWRLRMHLQVQHICKKMAECTCCDVEFITQLAAHQIVIAHIFQQLWTLCQKAFNFLLGLYLTILSHSGKTQHLLFLHF